ncbi:uncharacterized protein LOC142786394 isoform X3 [Rhipicephalus microplus]|uniref:uncharacterized protein LOC142786394 isoform X3 n=1 Tax=Rhipicephalus microplus TaxID=6941 RepID=UPI003F6AD767
MPHRADFRGVPTGAVITENTPNALLTVGRTTPSTVAAVLGAFATGGLTIPNLATAWIQKDQSLIISACLALATSLRINCCL